MPGTEVVFTDLLLASLCVLSLTLVFPRDVWSGGLAGDALSGNS